MYEIDVSFRSNAQSAWYSINIIYNLIRSLVSSKNGTLTWVIVLRNEDTYHPINTEEYNLTK